MKYTLFLNIIVNAKIESAVSRKEMDIRGNGLYKGILVAELIHITRAVNPKMETDFAMMV
jgi:hypothetical protein